MNDLVLSGVDQRIDDEKARAARVFSKIRSFSDMEMHLLRGFGLSPRTYAVYLSTVRQLYYFTGRELPFRVTPEQIEAFFDAIRSGFQYTDDEGNRHSVKVDRSTAVSKIAALKTFYRHLEQRFPAVCPSPFRRMNEKLKEKLSEKPKGEKKEALSREEASRLLAYLKADETPKGRSNYALVRFMLATALRANEVCSLSWDDLEHEPGADQWYARGIGKGDRAFYQPVADSEAVLIARDTFALMAGRDPKPTDPVFLNLPRYSGDVPGRMTPHALWYRVRDLGEAAREAGVITRKLQFSPHLFRRTTATALDAAGMSLPGIQAFLRHSSPTTTERHYIINRQDARAYMTNLFQGVTA